MVVRVYGAQRRVGVIWRIVLVCTTTICGVAAPLAGFGVLIVGAWVEELKASCWGAVLVWYRQCIVGEVF